MTYDLEQLGPSGFEDVLAALAIKALGVDVQVMGSGRDGGRDLYTTETTKESVNDTSGRWHGYTVVQAKHKETLADPKKNAQWLWERIRDELDQWNTHPDRERTPDNLLFATNVPLTPVPGVGSHDWIHAKVEAHLEALKRPDHGGGQPARGRLARLKTWAIWDRSKLEALLDAHDSVRQSVPGFLTVGDVFANLAMHTGTLPAEELEPGLRSHARTLLVGDGTARFQEAGTDVGPPTPLHDIVVDLPVIDGRGNRDTIVRSIVSRAERLLHPSFTTVKGPRNLVITGAPGNGKTTIARFVIQAYRAALLRGGQGLGAGHLSMIEGIDGALSRFGCGPIRHRRWPILVDLARCAQDGGFDEGSTLLRWIATSVSQQSNAGTVTPSLMQTWLRRWPWLLILDGLDEVTDPATRQRLIGQVSGFVEDAVGDLADVLVVVTTRPTGYTEDIDSTMFDRLDLGQLEPDEAIAFGVKASEIRLRGDVDRLNLVTQRLRQAAEDDNLKKLLQTPLQVLILAFIIDSVGTVAPYRYGLFWEYYSTVYRREKAKVGGLNHILTKHHPQILRLHEAVAFALHARSERGDGSYAVLSQRELRSVTRQILNDDGFDPSGSDNDLVEALITAATKRLVLIKPRGDSGYGFEVRSLQELMAARCLLDGTQEQREDRLRITAASPHWRNTWLFAAGRILDDQRANELRSLMELIQTIDRDADARLGRLVPIAHVLALDVIDDGMTEPYRRDHEGLLDHALGVLREPVGSDTVAAVRTLLREADASTRRREMIADAIRIALADGGIATTTALHVQTLIPKTVKALGLRANLRALATVKSAGSAEDTTASPADWTDFREELATAPVSDAERGLLEEARADVEDLLRSSRSPAEYPGIARALASVTTAAALHTALSHVGTAPELRARLRDLLTATVHREPVTDQLHGTGVPQWLNAHADDPHHHAPKL